MADSSALAPQILRAATYTKKRRCIAIVSSLGLVLPLYIGVTQESDIHSFLWKLSDGNAFSARLAEFVLIVSPILLTFSISAWLQYRLDRNYEISVQQPSSFFQDLLRRTALRIIFWFAGFCSIYLSYWLCGERWWVACAIISGVGWAGYLYLFPAIVLPLFFKLEHLDEALASRIQCLALKGGVQVGNVYKMNFSAKSKRSNLAVSGFGDRRTLLVTDTLLGSCSAAELEALIAHELGHIKHRHMEKRAASLMALCFFSCWTANQFLNLTGASIGRIGSFASVSLAVTIPLFWGFFFLLKLWRRNEFTADEFAFRLIGDTTPFVAALSRLSQENLILVTKKNQHNFSHPATEERIRRAKAFNAVAASVS